MCIKNKTRKLIKQTNSTNKTHSNKLVSNNHCHKKRKLCFVSCEGIQGLAIKQRDRAHRKRHRGVRGKRRNKYIGRQLEGFKQFSEG